MLAKQPRVQTGAARRPAVGAPALLARLPPVAPRRGSSSRARAAAKLDEVPLFASGDSLMSGPSPTASTSGGAAAAESVADKINAVPLNSEVRRRDGGGGGATDGRSPRPLCLSRPPFCRLHVPSSLRLAPPPIPLPCFFLAHPLNPHPPPPTPHPPPKKKNPQTPKKNH